MVMQDLPRKSINEFFQNPSFARWRVVRIEAHLRQMIRKLLAESLGGLMIQSQCPALALVARGRLQRLVEIDGENLGGRQISHFELRKPNSPHIPLTPVDPAGDFPRPKQLDDHYVPMPYSSTMSALGRLC